MSTEFTYPQNPEPRPAAVREQDIEDAFISKFAESDRLQRSIRDNLRSLGYEI